MDESKSTNGAEISPTGSKENETKEKVDKTLLLKQQIEENRLVAFILLCIIHTWFVYLPTYLKDEDVATREKHLQ